MSLAYQRPPPPSLYTTPSYYSDEFSLPPSPPATQSVFEDHSHRKRPSLSTTISGMSNWLSSHRSQAPAQHTAIRISDPVADPFAPGHRFKMAVSRTLGMGAEVVRTPTEALSSFPVDVVEDEFRDESDARRNSADMGSIRVGSPSADSWTSSSPYRSPKASRSSPHLDRTNTPPKPKRAIPPLPLAEGAATRPVMRSVASAAGAASPHSVVTQLPPLPNFRPLSGFSPAPTLPDLPAPPIFSPIIISPCCNPQADPSQLLVQIETMSSTLTTTMSTLTATPSRLSNFLLTMLPPTNSPPPSPNSPFSSAFASHQESMGLRTSKSSTSSHLNPNSPSTRMHLFLDRPSASYPHIVSFLRSALQAPTTTKPSLPRVLTSPSLSSKSALEPLHELREEAHFIGLTSLQKLAEEELLRRLNASGGFSSPGSRHKTSSSAGSGTGVHELVVTERVAPLSPKKDKSKLQLDREKMREPVATIDDFGMPVMPLSPLGLRPRSNSRTAAVREFVDRI